MNKIKIKVINKEPIRKDFEELANDKSSPDYVLFNTELKEDINLIPDVLVCEGTALIILSEDNLINWNNVAIPKNLYYELGLLHFRNYKRVLAHYLTLQKSSPIIKCPILKQVTDIVIDPYFQDLLQLGRYIPEYTVSKEE